MKFQRRTEKAHLFRRLRLARENEPQEIRNSARPAEHGWGHIRIGDQEGESPGRLGLGPTPISRDRHRLEQPINNGATSSPNNGGPAAGIGSGDVRKESCNTKLEARADLVVGRGQDGAERVPEDGGGDARLFGVMEKSSEGLGGFEDGVSEAVVERVGRLVVGVGGDDDVRGDQGGGKCGGEGDGGGARES